MARARRARWHFVLVLPAWLGLALTLGCASGAKPTAMAPGGLPAVRELDAERLAEVPTLTIRTTGGRATHPLHTSQISNADFSEALALEILRSGAFRPVYDQNADYHLHVHLAEIDRPFWGFLDMAVRVTADWHLYQVESGRLVWQRRVQSEFTATGADSSLGIRRLRLANEGSARRNIAEGVSRLVALAPAR
jgi:hypothetical protein